MAISRRRPRTRFVLAALVLAALTLVTIDSRSAGSSSLDGLRTGAHAVFAPLEDATHAVLQPIGNFLTGAIHYGSLRAENQRLRQEVASLQQQGATAAAEQQAAEQVLAEQHLPFVGGIPTVDVQVIDRGASNFESSLTVDKGTRSGVAVGQPVVAAGGLVGTVTQAGPTTASVTLLTDPTFTVGVRLDPSNVGAAQGAGAGRDLRVRVITTSQPPPSLHRGEVLATSGLNGEAFPANIPVGRVARAAKASGSTEPEITLAPLVDLAQLRYLQILLWSPQ